MGRVYSVRQIVDENSSEGYVKNNSSTSQKYRLVHVPFRSKFIKYLATGYQKVVTIYGMPFNEHAGNEPAAAEYCYFSVAVVIHKLN